MTTVCFISHLDLHCKSLSYFHLYFPNETNFSLIWISQWKLTAIKSLKPRVQIHVGRQHCWAWTGMVPAGSCARGCQAPTGRCAPCWSRDSPAAGGYTAVSTYSSSRGTTKLLIRTIKCSRLQEGTCRRNHVKHSRNTSCNYSSALEHLWHQAIKFKSL